MEITVFTTTISLEMAVDMEPKSKLDMDSVLASSSFFRPSFSLGMACILLFSTTSAIPSQDNAKASNLFFTISYSWRPSRA